MHRALSEYRVIRRFEVQTLYQGRLSPSTDGTKCAVDTFKGNFIKCFILSFIIENIVNFVTDVSVKFYAHKIHIIIAVK